MAEMNGVEQPSELRHVGQSITDQEFEDMTEEELGEALESFADEASVSDVNELFKTMNEESIISWDEVEHFLSSMKHVHPLNIVIPSRKETSEKSQSVSGGRTPVVKSGLPENMRPSEPENCTDVDDSIRRLLANDPSLTEININNMKCLLEALKSNVSLVNLNLETNYLSGEFLVRLFDALLTNQTVEEIRVSNQGLACSSQCETQIMDAICENETLRKVGLTFRKQEARHKVDQALFRNNELRRLNRQEDQKYERARANFNQAKLL